MFAHVFLCACGTPHRMRAGAGACSCLCLRSLASVPARRIPAACLPPRLGTAGSLPARCAAMGMLLLDDVSSRPEVRLRFLSHRQLRQLFPCPCIQTKHTRASAGLVDYACTGSSPPNKHQVAHDGPGPRCANKRRRAKFTAMWSGCTA